MKVSEPLVSQIENTQLRLQLLQAQAEGVIVEQRALVETARKRVKAQKGQLYNFLTHEFQDPA